jgi:prevent-host-death family protein
MYNSVHGGTITVVTDTNDISVADLRKNLAEVLNDAAVQSKTFYVTRNGRRIAAIVPVPVAEQLDQTPG